MTTRTESRPFAALDPCPCCGVHRWERAEIDGVIRPGLYRCRECNGVSEQHDLVSVGRD